MLEILRRIVQEVNAAHDLSEKLELMVQHVKKACDAGAASIFLIDPHRSEFILMATDGLNPDIVGNVRFGIDKGVVGLVGRREEPISMEDCHENPNFFSHAGLGEEKFNAFLGVPIIHHRRLYGVLTIQDEEKRRFDEAEEAFLVTISAQLASVIAHADAIGQMSKLAPFAMAQPSDIDEAAIGGIPSVPGVAIGQAVVVYPPADLDAVPDRDAEDIDHEITLLEQAVASARRDIENLSQRLANTLPAEEHALFDVYSGILGSSGFIDAILEHVKKGQWAQGALRKVISKHVNQFEAMEDAYLRERASDFRDLGRRVLFYLQTSQTTEIDYPENTVLVGDDIAASALAEVPEGHLIGVVSSQGSSNSHVAILARAMGVPTVMSAKGAPLANLNGKQVIVDGYFGQIYVSPSSALLQEFEALAESLKP